MSDDSSNRNPDGTFKKGFTANRKGAPPKSKRKRLPMAYDILFDEAFDPVAKDLPPELTPADEAAYRTYVAALKKDSKRARRTILKHIQRRAEERVRLDKQNNPKPVERTVEYDVPDDVDKALLILGIAIEDAENAHPSDTSPRLKLLPWAVQAALGRRHGGRRLSSEDIQGIERVTDNPAEIRWPRGYGHSARKIR